MPRLLGAPGDERPRAGTATGIHGSALSARTRLPDCAESAEKGREAEEEADKVKLMTIHAAKGLEFPYVFLCGLNEGIFPTRKTDTLPGMEEERRIAFVAVTRAKKSLYLTEAEGRNLDASQRYPSRFLLDIDRPLVVFTEPPREELFAQTARMSDIQNRSFYAAELEPLAVGTKVEHVVFGVGEIKAVDRERLCYTIHFDSLGTDRSISFKVNLKPVRE